MVIGEDVDRSIIGATRGLIDDFGDQRVRNTPISEATFVGACVGAAAVGLRPVVDLMVGVVLLRRDGPARGPGREAALHVRRPGRPADRLLHRDGPVAASGAAQHSENPHPMLMNVGRTQDRHAVHAVRRQGPHALSGPRPQPGRLPAGLRPRRHQGPRARRSPTRSRSASPTSRGRAPTSPWSPSAPSCRKALKVAAKLEEDGISRRGRRPAHAGAARHGHHPRLGEQDRAPRGRATTRG